MTTRRGLITGLISFVAAPAIVRATSLMPVRAWRPGRIICFGDSLIYGDPVHWNGLGMDEIYRRLAAQMEVTW